jgi:DNA-binding MarR family transcriptional regulator
MKSDLLSRSPVHLLHRAAQSVEKAFEAKVAGKGVTPRQLIVLATIGGHEGLNQTQIVERTNIDRSTTADIVRRLLNKGWVQRRRAEDDARAYTVRLTHEGRRVVRTVEPMSRLVDDRVLGALGASQRKRFIEALCLIVKKFG